MRILIFKLGFIGDVIMSLPALVELRTRMPDAHITWVVDRPALPILQATQLIDEFVVLEEKKIAQGPLWKRGFELLAFWKRLGINRYDRIIVGHADSKVRVLLLPARGKQWRQFNRNGDAWGTIFPVPGRHHSHEFIKLFGDVSYPNTATVTYPKLTLPDVKTSHPLPTTPFVTLAPGGTQSTPGGSGWLRRWPTEYYVALAGRLLNEGYAVALIGGKDDDWVTAHFDELPVHNYIGKFPLLETISFLSYSRLLVTNDCGPLHFSALADTPVLGIFGPTNPQEKIPFHKGSSFVWGGEALSCRPCYDNKVYAPCTLNTCLTSVPVDLVWQRVQTYL
ncbi:MAG: glycosyltransferase family 9 protein [Bacteroidetes bacterium]|nr:glycosyltransferase family 9 protein [Fibrella sp.]